MNLFVVACTRPLFRRGSSSVLVYVRRCAISFACSVMLPAQAADTPPVIEAMRLASEGIAASEAQDAATFLARMEEAAALRPDLPQLLSNLGAAQAAAGQPKEAIATLERLAAMGIAIPLKDTEEFEALRGEKQFPDLVKKFAANERPKGRGEIAFVLRDMTGLIEGIAWREKTGSFCFGDVNGRAVWQRTKDGKVKRLTAEGDELLGVFGVAIDEANGALWAATSAVSAMRGYTPDQQGVAALVEIDLETGAVRRTFAVPAATDREAMTLLGDVVVAADGTVYVTDSGERCIWRLLQGADALDRFLEHPEFISPEGMVVTPSGIALLTDRTSGLLRIELESGTVTPFEPPVDTTLAGLDGVAMGKGNTVVAVQSGVRPPRIVRIDFDGAFEAITAVTVLESGHYTMAAPSLGCIGPAGEFYFVGNGGWPRFSGSDGEPTPPRPVPIFKTALTTKR